MTYKSFPGKFLLNIRSLSWRTQATSSSKEPLLSSSHFALTKMYEELKLGVRLLGNQSNDTEKSDPPIRAGKQKRAEVSTIYKRSACFLAQVGASHQQAGAVNKLR